MHIIVLIALVVLATIHKPVGGRFLALHDEARFELSAGLLLLFLEAQRRMLARSVFDDTAVVVAVVTTVRKVLFASHARRFE